MSPVPQDLQTALSSRYEFQTELGRGGMATVYRAMDLRHQRTVAVKVMDSKFAASPGADRFLREIEVAAGLTHPHILSVHDSGEIAGELFYVMPLVEGESLRQRLEREKTVPLPEALRIVTEVADGLDYAHRHGVVHRDVKPGNILLAEDHAYIADFGIARIVELDFKTDLTGTGITVGTPSYMSPEQAGGERDIDRRSDMYSLACVLYEMLSGSPPFTGSTPQAVLVKRITETPPPIRQVQADVPPGVERALDKALATDREDRYETVGVFADSLVPSSGVARRTSSLVRRIRYGARTRLAGHPVMTWTLGAATLAAVVLIAWGVARLAGIGAPEARSAGAGGSVPGDAGGTTIAVLYFDDLSSDGSMDAYARGFTEALIHRINLVPGLVAPSLVAVRPFRDQPASPDSMAAVLGADFLVEGSILGSQDALRVNVSLVDPVSGTPLGQSRVESGRGDLLALVDGVSDSLSSFLRPRVGHEVRLRELRDATESDEAWDLVWRAEAVRETHQTLLEDSEREQADRVLTQADSLLALAESLDPTWAEPVVLRGWVAVERALVFAEEAGEWDAEDRPLMDAALVQADQALSLDPENADALALRGTVKFGLARTVSFTETTRSALLEEAERDLRAAGEAGPMQAEAWVQLGDLILYFRADFAGAKEAYLRALHSDPFLDEAEEIAIRVGSLSTDLEEYDDAWFWYQEGRRRWPETVEFPALGLITLASRSGPEDVETAGALADTIMQTLPPDRFPQYLPIWEAQVSTVLWRAGLQDSARTVLLRAEASTPDSIAAYDLAHAWLVQGDVERCLEWLAIDLEANPGDKAYRANEPWFRPLHQDPRFQELVRVEEVAGG